MKLLKWTRKAGKDAKEGQLFLRLFEDGGDVLLRVVDSSGDPIEQGAIIKYDNDMNVLIYFESISASTGIKTNITGSPLIHSVFELKELASEGRLSVVYGDIATSARGFVESLLKAASEK